MLFYAIGRFCLVLYILPLFTLSVPMSGQTYRDGTSNKVFSGTGTQADPYLIGTPEQLAGLVENSSADIRSYLQGVGVFVQHNEGVIRNCTTTGTMQCSKSLAGNGCFVEKICICNSESGNPILCGWCFYVLCCWSWAFSSA